MTFAAPSLLALILAVVLLVGFDAARPWNARIGRRSLAVLVRFLVLSLLVLALARPSVVAPGGEGTTVFVVDRSASIPDALLARALDEATTLAGPRRSALVLLDGEAHVAVAPGAPWQLPEPVREVAAQRSDLGLGVQVAVGLIDPSTGGRVVLFTDGADTAGGLLDAAAAARGLGVPVDVRLIDVPATDPAVTRLELDADVVRPGETVGAIVAVRGGEVDGRGVLRMELDGELIDERPVELVAGETRRIVVEHALDVDAGPGPRRLTAHLDVEPDPTSNNNALTVGLTVGEQPTALLVSSSASELEGMARVLRAERFDLLRKGPGELDASVLLTADLVVIGDVPARGGPGEDALPPAFIEALRRWVSAGGGLVTLGGDRTYELGGWGQTPLAGVLPLDLSPDAEDVEPAVALVQILDSSASMGDWSGHHTKMALANEGAVASMRLLREKDHLAVYAVDTEVDEVLSLQPVADPLRISAAIRGIKPRGGGIYTYSALVAAEEALLDAGTPMKHVVLYADAQDAEEKVQGHPFGWGPGPTAYQVVDRMRRAGATVSVIALGDPRDQDKAFLERLALQGGGRFHITREPEELRALFVEETRQVVHTVVHDTAFQARAASVHPVLDGVDLRRAPPLLGYVDVEARPTATTVLTGVRDRPVLATWRYGLGQVASFSSDLGPRWGQRWLGWGDYARLVTQLARWAVRPPLARGTGIEVHPADGGVRIEVVRRGPDGLALPDRGLVASLVHGEQREELPLVPESPGRWIGTAELPAGDTRMLVVRDATTGDEVGRQAFVVPPSVELDRGRSPQLQELPARTGGAMNPEQLAAPPPGRGRPTPIGWLPALVALLLFPVDAWLRRPARER